MITIPAPTGGNSEGIYQLRLLPAEWLHGVDYNSSGTTIVNNSLKFSSPQAYDLVDIYFSGPANCSFSEKEKFNEQGRYYEWLLEFVIPKDRLTIPASFLPLEKKALIAFTMDGNQVCRMIGTKEFPLMPIFDFGSNPNEYQVNLTGRSTERAKYLANNIMDAFVLKTGAFSKQFNQGFN